MNVVTVSHVSKIFRRVGGRRLIRDVVKDLFRAQPDHSFYALRDVSFQVGSEESVAIIGANGAGKSTLLSLIVGLVKPDSGSVDVDGRVTALLELGSGFHPDLTGAENLHLNAALLGYTRKQTQELMGPIIEFAELEQFIHEPLRTYSAGMVMRLAFAIAVQVDPTLLVIDEVLAVGDARFAAKCFDRIQSLRNRGKTLLCVSHSPTILEMCERAIWLDHGELIMDGSATRVMAAYESYMTAPHQSLPPRMIEPAPKKVRLIRGGKAISNG
ncbi:MAG: sugar ABC transporter ATP-binding protein [Terriglobia bacterium]|nr:MAG: sugar ABC transporter ATP-binding protein [Terriglobia bacterium]